MDYFIQLLLAIPGVIIAMTFHEYAHARAAVVLGDFTPRLLMLLFVRFGWAKPVMINPRNFGKPRRDDILVSVAGPAMNLFLGFIAFYVMKLSYWHYIDVSPITYEIIQMICVCNINFAIFNMLPIPPLDGSHILRNLLPPNLAYRYQSIEQYSMLILVVCVVTPIPQYILKPLGDFVIAIYSILLRFLM